MAAFLRSGFSVYDPTTSPSHNPVISPDQLLQLWGHQGSRSSSLPLAVICPESNTLLDSSFLREVSQIVPSKVRVISFFKKNYGKCSLRKERLMILTIPGKHAQHMVMWLKTEAEQHTVCKFISFLYIIFVNQNKQSLPSQMNETCSCLDLGFELHPQSV